MKLLAISALACALVFAAACGRDKKDTYSAAGTIAPTFTTPPRATSTPAQAATAPPAAQKTRTGGKKTYSAAPPMTIDTSKKYTATIKMDIGEIVIDLYAKDAPETVNSFVFLARDHFYDGVTFHRVVPGFVAQAGDPDGTGRGGPGYTVKDEVNSHKFLEGSVGMAKTAAPNSAGSQWFIDYTPQPSLDGKYTVFGQLIKGRDVLDKITPRDPQSATQPGTVIKTIEIAEQ